MGGLPFTAFCAMGASMVKAALARVGWTARPEDSHTDKLLRAAVVGMLPGEYSNDAKGTHTLSSCG